MITILCDYYSSNKTTRCHTQHKHVLLRTTSRGVADHGMVHVVAARGLAVARRAEVLALVATQPRVAVHTVRCVQDEDATVGGLGGRHAGRPAYILRAGLGVVRVFGLARGAAVLPLVGHARLGRLAYGATTHLRTQRSPAFSCMPSQCSVAR